MEDDAQDLDELVVVGYGTQKKASLTGSIETIKSEDLLSLPTANLDEALYGQVAGLQVMQTTGDPSSAKEANLHIRGINNSPLLVIDGVPLMTDANLQYSPLGGTQSSSSSSSAEGSRNITNSGVDMRAISTDDIESCLLYTSPSPRD